MDDTRNKENIKVVVDPIILKAKSLKGEILWQFEFSAN